MVPTTCQALLHLLRKISHHFSNSNYTNVMNVHVFLKQLNDFISFPIKSEWLIRVTYQLRKPNSRHGQSLSEISKENTACHRKYIANSMEWYTLLLHQCWADTPVQHEETLLLTTPYFKDTLKPTSQSPPGTQIFHGSYIRSSDRYMLRKSFLCIYTFLPSRLFLKY